MHHFRSAITLLISILMLMSIGCSGESTSQSTNNTSAESGDGPITVISTIGMITDPASIIAGEHAMVSGLVGSGIDPHLYKPTRTDISKLMDADAVLYCGLMLEGRMTDAFVRIASSGIIVRAVSEAVDPSSLLEPEELEGHHDPHLWMDPRAWSLAMDVIAETLGQADPAHADDYQTNAASYKAQIAELDAYAVQALASVPESQRVLVTAHDAFNYFGERYGYEVVGIQGISTESEAGVRDIERIVDLLVERKVRAVFVETTVSERNINALIAGAKARGHDVVIGGSLFSDAMGEEGTYEGTYIGMIDHNVTTIVRALGGEAPELGMSGKLSQ